MIVRPPTATFRSRLDRPAIENRRRWRAVPTGGNPDDLPEIVGHRLEATRRNPPSGLLVNRRPRWEIVEHHSPMAAGLDQPTQGVENLAQVVLSLRRVLSHQVR